MANARRYSSSSSSSPPPEVLLLSKLKHILLDKKKDQICPGPSRNAALMGRLKKILIPSQVQEQDQEKEEVCRSPIPARPPPPHTSMIEMLCRAGKFHEAYRTGVAMLRHGLSVDARVLNTVAYGLYKSGLRSDSFNLLKEMNAGASFLDKRLIEQEECPSSDLVSFTALVDGLCKAGKFEEAYLVFKQSSATATFSDYSAATCNALLNGLEAAQAAPEHVFHTAVFMLRKGIIIANSSILNSLIPRFCEAEEEELLLQAFRTWPEAAFFRLDHQAMLAELCTSGKPDKASRFVADMAQRGIQLHQAFIKLQGMVAPVQADVIVSNLCQERRAEAAWDFFKGVQQQRQHPASNSYSSANLILKAFCDEGVDNAAAAVEVFSWMVSQRQTPDAASSSVLIKRLVDSGNIEQALHVYRNSDHHKLKLDIGYFNALLRGSWASGNDNEAVKLFQQMVRSGAVPDATTCSILIRGLCTAGKLDTALKILELMSDIDCPPDVESYNLLLETFAEQGDDRGVEMILNQMQHPNLVSYNTAYLCFLRAGRHEDIPKLFERMVGTSGCKPSEQTTELVVSGLCKAGFLDEAWDVVQQAVGAGLGLSDCAYKPYVIALLKSGKVEQACHVFEKLNLKEEEENLRLLVGCFLEADMVAQACDLYKSRMEMGAPSLTFMVGLVCSQQDNMQAACAFLDGVGADVSGVVEELLLKLGRLDAAAKLLNEGLKMKLISPAAAATGDMCSTCLRLLLDENKVESACSLLESMVRQGVCETGLSRHWIRTLVAADKIEAAKMMLEACSCLDDNKEETNKNTKKKKKELRLYDRVIRDICKLGRFPEAADVLEHLYDKGVLHKANERMIQSMKALH